MTRLAGIAALVLLVGLAWYLAPLEPGVLALQFAFTPRSFAAIVQAWPPEQLLRYRAHFPVDFVLLACYGVFGWRLATRTALFAGYPSARRRAAAWALPLAGLFDAAENGLHLWLTEAPGPGMALPYFVSATCSTLKWALLVAFAVAVLHAVARRRA